MENYPIIDPSLTCDSLKVENISEKVTRKMCIFYSNKRVCTESNCPHIVGDLAAD